MNMLKQWRKELNATQKEMAVFIGVPVRTWMNWEKGDRKPPPVALSLIDLLKQLQIIAPSVFQARLNNAKRG